MALQPRPPAAAPAESPAVNVAQAPMQATNPAGTRLGMVLHNEEASASNLEETADSLESLAARLIGDAFGQPPKEAPATSGVLNSIEAQQARTKDAAERLENIANVLNGLA